MNTATETFSDSDKKAEVEEFRKKIESENKLGFAGTTHAEWLQTEMKSRFCKTSENYFKGSRLKVQVKLPLKIEKWGSTYIEARGYD